LEGAGPQKVRHCPVLPPCPVPLTAFGCNSTYWEVASIVTILALGVSVLMLLSQVRLFRSEGSKHNAEATYATLAS
jgi:hypothetical protein